MENENNNAEIIHAVQDGEARVNVTWAGQNGDLVQPVMYDSTDGDIKQWVTEAVRTGTVPGIDADEGADFTDFVVDRFQPTEARPWNLIQLRPKTPFGKKGCAIEICLSDCYIGPLCKEHFDEFQGSGFEGSAVEWVAKKNA